MIARSTDPSRNVGLPDAWFVVPPGADGDEEADVEFDGEDPTGWAAASGEAPAVADRLLDLYSSSVEDFGGNAGQLQEGTRVDVSLDGKPRELRLSTPAGSWASLLLWSDSNVDLWIEGLALQEAQRQRALSTTSTPHGSEREDGNDTGAEQDDVVDPDEYDYQLLAEAQIQLVPRQATFASLVV